MKFRKWPLAALLLVALFVSGEARAQNLDPFLSVQVDRLRQYDSEIGTAKAADLKFIADSTSSDTSQWFRPWKWTGISFAAHGDIDSTNVMLSADCGNRIGQVYVVAVCDTFRIMNPGHYVWQFNIPLSEWVRVRMVGDTTSTENDSTVIDSASINRNW